MLTAPFLGSGTTRSGGDTYSTASGSMGAQGLRNAPPRPLGEDVDAFPYGASTGFQDADDLSPTLSVRVDLPADEGRTHYLSGETVHGIVRLQAARTATFRADPNAFTFLQIRLYYESRTLFWKGRLNADSKGKGRSYAAFGVTEATYSVGHEWHRAVADDAILSQGQWDSSGDDPILACLAAPGFSHQWRFALHIPERLVRSECNDVVDRNGVYRDISDIPRPPPPSLRNANASVEWVVEATMRVVSSTDPSDNAGPGLSPDEDQLPAFGEETGSALVDERGFALSVPPTLLVTRATLPVLPADEHCLALSNLASFGQSPLKRAETGGAELVDIVDEPSPAGKDGDTAIASTEALEPVISIPPELQRIATSNGSVYQVWNKRVSLEGKLGLSRGVIVSQVAVPRSLIIPRHAQELTLKIRLAHIPPSRPALLRRFAGSKDHATSSKPSDGKAGSQLTLEAVSVRLSARTLTRGGRDGKPYLLLREVQKHDFVGSEVLDAISTEARVEDAKWRELEVKLQNVDGESQESNGKGKERSKQATHVPAGRLTPSFRTPNIEYEYIVTVNVIPANEHLFCAARFPIQLTSGERAAVPPSFEASQQAPLS